MSSTRSPVTAGIRMACAAISGGASPIHCWYHPANWSYLACVRATLPTLTGSARIAICLAVRFQRKPSSGQSTRWQACAAPSRIPAPPRPTGSRERGCESRPHISDSAGLARSAPTDSGMHHQRRKRQWPPAVTVMARMYPPFWAAARRGICDGAAAHNSQSSACHRRLHLSHLPRLLGVLLVENGSRCRYLSPMGGEPVIVVGDRKELTYLLSQAAELEHGLMCEYLYAAFSL